MCLGQRPRQNNLTSQKRCICSKTEVQKRDPKNLCHQLKSFLDLGETEAGRN